MLKAEDDCLFDKLHEECGVFALYGHPEAANLVYLGLYALQHRGQESAGIASSDGKKIHNVRKMGHVADIFTPDVLNHCRANWGLGTPVTPPPATPACVMRNRCLSLAAKARWLSPITET